ncbi:hypothetical protein [Fervidibacter sacchari]
MAIGERMGGRGSCRAKNGSDWRMAIGERQRIAKWRDEKMGVLKFLTSFRQAKGGTTMAHRCPKCGKEMARHGKFWFCGEHTEPVFIPIEHPFSDLCAVLPTPHRFRAGRILSGEQPFHCPLANGGRCRNHHPLLHHHRAKRHLATER